MGLVNAHYVQINVPCNVTTSLIDQSQASIQATLSFSTNQRPRHYVKSAPVVSSDTGGVGTRAGTGGSQVTLATGATVTKLDSIAALGTGTGADGAADGALEPGSLSRATMGGGEGDLGGAGTVTGCWQLSSVSPEGVTA